MASLSSLFLTAKESKKPAELKEAIELKEAKEEKSTWCDNTNIYSNLLFRKYIHRPKIDHSINRDKAAAWINRHCQEEQKPIARALIDNIAYISFDEFLTALKRVSSIQLLPLLNSIWEKTKTLWTPFIGKITKVNVENLEELTKQKLVVSSSETLTDSPLWTTRWALKLVPELKQHMCKSWSLDPIESLQHGVSTFVLFNNGYNFGFVREFLDLLRELISSLTSSTLSALSINIIFVTPFITNPVLKNLSLLELPTHVKLIILYDTILPILEEKIENKELLKNIIHLYSNRLPYYFQYVPVEKTSTFQYQLGGYLPHKIIEHKEQTIEQKENEAKEYKKCFNERMLNNEPIINNFTPLIPKSWTEPWLKTKLTFDPEETGLNLITLPRGTVLIHERTTQFPSELDSKITYPFFAYNWYSSKPFWTQIERIGSEEPIARYVYQTKYDIPNIIWLDDWDELDLLQQYFKSLYPEYPIMIGQTSDYGVAAFTCQVLGLNGLIIHRVHGISEKERKSGIGKDKHDIIVLCNNISIPLPTAGQDLKEEKSINLETKDYLELKNVELINEPKIHPGYTSSTAPGGLHTTGGKVYYTKEEAKKIKEEFPEEYL